MFASKFSKKFDEELIFEKIISRKVKKDYISEKYKEQLDEQSFGSGHAIDDKLVKFDGLYRDNFKESSRPGIVITPPAKDSDFQTEWAPGTTKTANRNPINTILFDSKYGAKQQTVFLLQYKRYYKCTSLGKKLFKLPTELMDELKAKLEALQNVQ